jgi:hypothetical protein
MHDTPVREMKVMKWNSGGWVAGRAGRMWLLKIHPIGDDSTVIMLLPYPTSYCFASAA